MRIDNFSAEVLRASRKVMELSRVRSSQLSGEWAAQALEELATCVEELKTAEEELRVQNEELAEINAALEHERHRWRELFMAAPHAYAVTDLAGTVKAANRMAAELLGLSPAQLAGKPLPTFVVLGDRDRFTRWARDLRHSAVDRSLCADCGGRLEVDMRTFARDRSFPAQVIAAPIVERDGKIESIRWMIADLSDRHGAASAQKLREEARQKDEFLAVLGHELRNPLAAITLASDILSGERGVDPRRTEWAADVVKRHGEQLRRLVDDLLDLSRVTHGKVILQIADVDLRDVVTAASETAQPLLAGKRHTLAIEREDGPFMVRGDAARLTQVVANLLDNAAKYTPDGGRVSLRLARDGGVAVISVTDDGKGIPSNMLERIFDTFEQGRGGPDPQERGLGLGLSLVHQLVTLHGGSVRAASPGQGKGSTFTVELPLADAIDAAAAPASAAELSPAASPPRLLIIDDNADAAELLALALRGRGFVVDVAGDGASGLALATRHPVQVALVDLGLPDIDGFEVCRRLRAGDAQLQLVAITGYGDQRARGEADAAGFQRFLLKPVSPDAVVRTLRELAAAEPPP